MAKRLLIMRVNGEMVEVAIEPSTMLLHVLRGELGLTGAKEACGQGECGACTVLLDGKAVSSCITPAMKAKKVKHAMPADNPKILIREYTFCLLKFLKATNR